MKDLKGKGKAKAEEAEEADDEDDDEDEEDFDEVLLVKQHCSSSARCHVCLSKAPAPRVPCPA